MIIASFLSKDLLIDWRRGERYFMETLIDGGLCDQPWRVRVRIGYRGGSPAILSKLQSTPSERTVRSRWGVYSEVGARAAGDERGGDT
jgi:deoxyribodipyrimidine photo-lyase